MVGFTFWPRRSNRQQKRVGIHRSKSPAPARHGTRRSAPPAPGPAAGGAPAVPSARRGPGASGTRSKPPAQPQGRRPQQHAQQSGQARRQIGVAIVDRQQRAAMGLDALLTPLHRIGQRLAGARPEKTHCMMTSRLQFARMHRRACALQIARCGVDTELQITDMEIQGNQQQRNADASTMLYGSGE